MLKWASLAAIRAECSISFVTRDGQPVENRGPPPSLRGGQVKGFFTSGGTLAPTPQGHGLAFGVRPSPPFGFHCSLKGPVIIRLGLHRDRMPLPNWTFEMLPRLLARWKPPIAVAARRRLAPLHSHARKAERWLAVGSHASAANWYAGHCRRGDVRGGGQVMACKRNLQSHSRLTSTARRSHTVKDAGKAP